MNLDNLIKSVMVLFEPNEEAAKGSDAMVVSESEEQEAFGELSGMMVVLNEDYREEQYRTLTKVVRSNIRTKEHAELLEMVQEDTVQNERLRGIDVKKYVVKFPDYRTSKKLSYGLCSDELVTEGFVESIRTFQTQVYQVRYFVIVVLEENWSEALSSSG